MPNKASFTDNEVLKLSERINNVYNDAESGMWKMDNSRTTPDEINNLIQKKRLLVAYCNNTLAGAVVIKSMPDKKTGEFGMLSADKAYRGLGIGSALVNAAEHWAIAQGFSKMRLEILTPRNWEHPSKTFIKDWYHRMGYAPDKTEPFEVMYPDKFKDLATECDFTVWYKVLWMPTSNLKNILQSISKE